MALARIQGLTLTFVLHSVSYELRANKENQHEKYNVSEQKHLKLITELRENQNEKQNPYPCNITQRQKLEVKHTFSQHSHFRNHSTPLFPPLSPTWDWQQHRALKGN